MDKSQKLHREKELLRTIPKSLSPQNLMDIQELLSIRLERYKNMLVTDGNDVTRGHAQALRDLGEKFVVSTS